MDLLVDRIRKYLFMQTLIRKKCMVEGAGMGMGELSMGYIYSTIRNESRNRMDVY
jgi:hypothetical protein